MTDQDIIDALKIVSINYSKALAATIERIFRNETAHFESDEFRHALSPGMEAFSDKLPYGWTSLADYWNLNPTYAPTGIFKEIENSSNMMKSRGDRKFLVFASIEDSMMSVAYIISKRGGDGARWFSNENTPTGEDARKKYDAVLNSIIPRFSNLL